MFGANKFSIISALAGKTGTQLSAEMIAKANQELANEKITGVKLVSAEVADAAEANATKVTDLQTQLDTATADGSTKANRITALEQELAQAKADNKSAGDTHTTTTSTKTVETDGTGKDPDAAWNGEDLPWNKAAAEFHRK